MFPAAMDGRAIVIPPSRFRRIGDTELSANRR
jgi:hypothetical protein